jgi:hypothetical protein
MNGRRSTGKQPYAIGLKGGGLMAMAGLWEPGAPPSSGERVRSFGNCHHGIHWPSSAKNSSMRSSSCTAFAISVLGIGLMASRSGVTAEAYHRPPASAFSCAWGRITGSTSDSLARCPELRQPGCGPQGRRPSAAGDRCATTSSRNWAAQDSDCSQLGSPAKRLRAARLIRASRVRSAARASRC